MHTLRRQLIGLSAAAAATCWLPGARAQTGFPDRPIRLVIPFPPGGPTDLFGRILGARLAEVLAQPVVIDNKPGASGIIACEFVARAKADGHTLLFGTAATHGINATLFRKLPYHPTRDFDSVAFVGVVPAVLLVNPAVPAASLRELIALLKANPGKLSFGSAGNGTTNHLAGELLKVATGTSAVHVPYKGSGPALQDLLGGQIQLLFETFGTALPHLQSGRLRALAVASARRSSAAPEVPTFAEAGVADFEASTWNVVMAPAGTPASALERLNGAVNESLRDPGVREKLVKLGIAAVEDSTPSSTTETIRREIAKWARAVEASGARAD